MAATANTNTNASGYTLLEGYGDVISSTEMAGILGRSEQAVRRMCNKGQLPGVFLAGRWIFPKTKVIAFLENTVDQAG